MKKSRIYIYGLIILIVVLLYFSSLSIDKDIVSDLLTLVTTLTAIIGAVAIFIQFKRDKDINQANFIVNYGKYFHEIKGNDEVYLKLERYQDGKKDIFNDDDYLGIINYLVWCEGLSVLIQNGTMDLPTVDNLFSYMFFLIVNNEYVQNNELIPSAEYYKGIFALHKIWSDYKKKTGQSILNEETDLSKNEIYLNYCQKGDLFDKKHF